MKEKKRENMQGNTQNCMQENIRVRILSPEEHESTRSLYEQVFNEDEPSFVDYYYQTRVRENVIWAAEAEGKIRGMLHLNPCQVSWHGEPLELPYIVAVATEISWRRQGIMGMLLKKSLQELKQKKIPFAFLMPAAEAIYTPYGFRRAWNWQWEEELILHTGAGEKGAGILRTVTIEKAAGTLQAASEEKAAGVLRAASVEEADTPLTYRPLADCNYEALQQLSENVNSCLAETQELFSLRSPEYYLRLQREQEASGGGLEVLFSDGVPLCARCQAREEFPPMMARIADLEEFTARIHTRDKAVRREIWFVRDEILEENNGLFEVELGPAASSIRRLDCEEETAEEAGEGCGGFSEAKNWTAEVRKNIHCLDIADIPAHLGLDNPFLYAAVCHVV